ncbi:MAG: cyclic beta 1-2 glucan synthetase, partial [Nitrospirae bacterium CG17_big_fil_post_rev_8_21_14_2_50_50_9]
MKVSNKTLLGSLPHLRSIFGGTDLAQKYAGDKPPLRSELFSRDQMEQHGKILAASHKLTPGHAPDQLLSRLSENEGVLVSARNLLADAVKADLRITPAGEWLLDNFYLIEEQIRTARRHLPKGYSRELPRLLNGPSEGIPRVYDIALETISHGDGRVDPENLSSFVAAYQTVSVLKLGELWAIPIMLRLALIENLRRVGARIAANMIERNRAAQWAEQMTEVAEKDPNSLILVIADMVRSDPPMVSSFVAEFTRRLQGQSPALALPLTWIEQRLSEFGLTIEQSVHSENRQQAADQVSISNSIGSLRFLGAMNWIEFVERMSSVEQVLREDPAGVYGKMDFATRDHYRHVVEKIAKSSRLSEGEVAAEAVRLAHESTANKDGARGRDDREAHVGYYLIDKGSPQLEELAHVRFSFSGAIRKAGSRFPLLLYLGTITLMTAIFTGGLLTKAHSDGLHNGLLVMTGILSLLCASQLAVAVVNWLATLLVIPQPLPRMDYSKGIPPESRTLAVIPTMLISAQNIEDLIEALEVRFLANRDENLHFGLLTDFQDAAEETLPEDEPLLLLARQRIEELNEKYRNAKGDTFFLFHRPRRWNARDRIWMGYERKRGKLADLNALLRCRTNNAPAFGAPSYLKRGKGELISPPFSLIVGNTEILSNVKYVITLDTDTQLPRDSARQFAGAMA